MNWIGHEIEKRRVALGMSRCDLARKLNVTTQTVLNIEHDENYNIGTRLLSELESLLKVEFQIVITEEKLSCRMSSDSDMFMLHLLKYCEEPSVVDYAAFEAYCWNIIRQLDPKAERVPGVRSVCAASNIFQYRHDREIIIDVYLGIERYLKGKKVLSPESVVIGSDECVYYILRYYPNSTLGNAQMGRRLSSWIQQRDPNVKYVVFTSLPWFDVEQAVQFGLPLQARQFTFRRELLPELFGFLDSLGIN